MNISKEEIGIIKEALQYALLYCKEEEKPSIYGNLLLKVEKEINKNKQIKEYPLTPKESFNTINYLDSVKEFMLTAGQPVYDKIINIPEDRNKLRITLIFEELKEYAEASGQLEYFNLLNLITIQDFQENYLDKNIEYVPIINKVEQLDALCDLQYVLSGTVHEHGFGNIFNAAFNEVQRSNMSKFCRNIKEADETIAYYSKENQRVYCNVKQLPIVIYRKEDNKVLKSINYSPANLKPIIDVELGRS